MRVKLTQAARMLDLVLYSIVVKVVAIQYNYFATQSANYSYIIISIS